MAEGNTKYIIIIFLLLLSVGFLLSLMLSSFLDTSTPNPNNSFVNGSRSNFSASIYNISVNILNASFLDLVPLFDFEIPAIFGFGPFDFSVPLPVINPLALLGQDAKDFVIEQLIALTYLPDGVFAILFIVSFIGLVYIAISTIRG